MTLTQQESFNLSTVAATLTYSKNNESSFSSSLLYVSSTTNSDTGFKAVLYQDTDTGKYVVSFNGSDDLQDWTGSNRQMGWTNKYL